MSLTVRTVSRCAETPAELWRTGPDAPPEGRWWYELLERSVLDDQFEFLYAVIERDSRPVGLAPLFVAGVPMELVAPDWAMPLLRLAARLKPSLLHQRTVFVGSPCADEGALYVAAGVDRSAIVLALGGAMEPIAREHKAAMLVWKDFPQADLDALRGLVRVEGFFEVVSFPGAAVGFSSSLKADYYAGLKSSQRANMRRRLRRSAAMGDAVIEVVTQPNSSVLDEIFGLFRQTYDRATTRFENLNERFFAAAADLPNAYFLTLRNPQDQGLMGFMLLFQSGDIVINKFIGIDYGRPREWYIYFLLWDAAVDWALSVGAKTLQSGQTGYPAKLEIGHRLVPLTNFARHRNRLAHAIYAFVAKSITWKTLDSSLP